MRVSPLQDAVRRCTPLQGLALTLTGQVVGHAYLNARGHVTCCCLMMPLGCCAAQCPQQLDMLPCPPLQIMETQSEPFLDISEELAHVREAQTWVKGPSEHLWAAISACKGDLDTAGGLLARQHCADWVHTALMLLRVGCWHGHIVLLGAHHESYCCGLSFRLCIRHPELVLPAGATPVVSHVLQSARHPRGCRPCQSGWCWAVCACAVIPVANLHPEGIHTHATAVLPCRTPSRALTCLHQHQHQQHKQQGLSSSLMVPTLLSVLSLPACSGPAAAAAARAGGAGPACQLSRR